MNQILDSLQTKDSLEGKIQTPTPPRFLSQLGLSPKQAPSLLELPEFQALGGEGLRASAHPGRASRFQAKGQPLTSLQAFPSPACQLAFGLLKITFERQTVGLIPHCALLR